MKKIEAKSSLSWMKIKHPLKFKRKGQDIYLKTQKMRQGTKCSAA